MNVGLSVVIVNYNNSEDIISLLNCFKGMGDKLNEIIIVNNGDNNEFNELSNYCSGNEKLNTKASVEASVNHDCCIRLIQAEMNGGFGYGCNLGVKVARKSGSEFVWFLNPDCEFDGDPITPVMNYFLNEGASSVVGSKILGSDGKLQCNGGGFVSNFLGLTTFNTNEDQSVDLSFISGASLFIKIQDFIRIGQFYEPYFLYWEEVDLCQRAKNNGMGLHFESQSVITHKLGNCGESASDLADYYSVKNYFLFHTAHSSRLMNCIRFPIVTAMKVLNRLRRKQFGKAKYVLSAFYYCVLKVDFENRF